MIANYHSWEKRGRRGREEGEKRGREGKKSHGGGAECCGVTGYI